MDEGADRDGIVVTDAIDDREARFPFKNLIGTDYFKRYRHGYYKQRDELRIQIPPRNYYNLLKYLEEIHEYRSDDARTFAKMFRTAGSDWLNCEAIFAEVIVYRYYVRLMCEGIVKLVRLGRDECGIVVERLDGSTAYLEVFSIKPKVRDPKPGENFVVFEFKTHTQEAFASVRQKLLRKIDEQKQMVKERENYAVIELNNPSIAGDFAVLSSLSDGYKIRIDRASMKKVGEGYDWTRSVFDDEATRNLKGIIWFDLGDYESRRMIINPRFGLPTHEQIARRAYELFEQRGPEHGHDIDDWLQAERELRGALWRT
jgi:hypothetical protein